MSIFDIFKSKEEYHPKKYYLKNHLYKDKYYINVYFQEKWHRIIRYDGEVFEEFICLDVYDLNHQKLFSEECGSYWVRDSYTRYIDQMITNYEEKNARELKVNLQDKLAREELKNMKGN